MNIHVYIILGTLIPALVLMVYVARQKLKYKEVEQPKSPPHVMMDVETLGTSESTPPPPSPPEPADAAPKPKTRKRSTAMKKKVKKRTKK